MFYDNAWSIQQKCRMGGTDMCVGLSAKGDLEPGDYVMVHAGVAIAKITDDDEEETDQLMEELL